MFKRDFVGGIELVDAAQNYLINTALNAGPIERILCLMAIEEYPRGFGGSKHHHNFVGGLSVHVADVVQCCIKMAGPGVDLDVLLVAAFWHDYGKLKEYALVDGEIVVTPYAKLVGHVVGSTYALADASRSPFTLFVIPKHEEITHCMLAHHGRKEWGSPVEPATAEAWILHSADMLSSRGVL